MRLLNDSGRFPRCIEFQTNSLCNAACGCCPYPEVSREQPKGSMSEELLRNIIAQASEHRHELELLIPYFNNEPFADRRMLDILRMCKSEVDVPVELSSNISLLTPEKSRQLVAEDLVHTLRVSMFGMGAEAYESRMRGLRWDRFLKHFDALMDESARARSSMVVEVVMVSQEGLDSKEIAMARARFEPTGARLRLFGYLDRAGNNKQRNLIPLAQGFGRLSGCELNRPFERLVVRHDGVCVLCSQDWRGDVLVGNISSRSIEDVWRSSEAQQIRNMVCGKANSTSNFLCRQCKLAIVE